MGGWVWMEMEMEIKPALDIHVSKCIHLWNNVIWAHIRYTVVWHFQIDKMHSRTNVQILPLLDSMMRNAEDDP